MPFPWAAVALAGGQVGSSLLGEIGSSTGASNYGTTGTNFPVNFLNQGVTYGPSQSNPYLIGLPGSQPQGHSLFSFNQNSPGVGQPPPPALPPPSYDPSSPITIGFDDLAIAYGGPGGDHRKLADLQRMGFQPGQQYTLDQLYEIAGPTGPDWMSSRSQNAWANALGQAEGLITLGDQRRLVDQQQRAQYESLYSPEALAAQPSPYPELPQGLVQTFQSGNATGQTWDPQTRQWQTVSGNPDLVYWGPNDTVYYQGQPLTDQNQLDQLLTYGPAAAGIGPSQQAISQGIVANLTGAPPQINFDDVPWAQAPLNDPTQFFVNPQSFAATAGQASAPQASESGLRIAAPSVSAERAIAPPDILAPQVTATDIDYEFTPEYLQALIDERFLPQARELDRREEEMLAESEAMAAQRGMAGAGAWMAGERDYIKREFLNQVVDVHTDATNQAVTQFYGEKLQTAMTQAALDQERRMADAGFDYNAQVETARNTLTTSITNAELGTRARIAEAELRVRAESATLDAISRIRTANLSAATSVAVANLDAQTRANIATLNGQISLAQANLNSATQLQRGNQDAGVTTAVNNMNTWANLAGVNVNTVLASQQNQLSLLQEMGRDIRHLDEYELEAASILTNQQVAILGQIAGAGRFSQQTTLTPSSTTGLFG